MILQTSAIEMKVHFQEFSQGKRFQLDCFHSRDIASNIPICARKQQPQGCQKKGHLQMHQFVAAKGFEIRSYSETIQTTSPAT